MASKTMWRRRHCGWTPNHRSSSRDILDQHMQESLADDRAKRPQDGRYLTGGARMNRRDFRRWRRLLERTERMSNGRAWSNRKYAHTTWTRRR